MANWGEFVYGDGTLWGGTVVVYGTYPNVEYALSIDWNNDGTYSSSEQEQDTILDTIGKDYVKEYFGLVEEE